MARLQRRDLDRPTEVRTVPLGRLELFELGDTVVGRSRFEPGWRWSESIKPIAGTEYCEFHHVGYVLAGSVHVETREGAVLEIGPNEFYEIPPNHDAWVVGDEPWVSIDWGATASFGRDTADAAERMVSTVLFTDVVDSTATAHRLGDSRWRNLLAAHNLVVRAQLDRFRGREVTTTGDGFVALFDSAERAARAALAIVSAVPRSGLHVRVGIHTGEVELEAGNVRGLTVHLAARVVALAGADEVLVSWTTRDLLAGTELEFAERGTHEMKGLPEPKSVYAVLA